MGNIVYVGRHSLTKVVTNHMHNSWEIIYCTSGNGELGYNDKVLKYDEDSIVVIPPHLVHCNRSVDGFTNYHINMKDLSLNIDEPLIITHSGTNFLKDVFPAVFYYYSNDQPGRTMILQAYEQVLLATLHSYLADKKCSDTVKQVMDHIIKNYPDANFDLNGYLSSLPFSLEYLKRMFKNETGLTPLQFMTNKRLENAASFLNLMENGINISQISHKCGFNDPLYFSKLFKKKYGVSPRNYVQKKQECTIADPESIKIFINQ